METGNYKLGIALRDANGKLSHQLTNRTVTIGAGGAVVFEKLSAPVITEDINQNVDVLESQGRYIRIAGWAHFKNQDTGTSEISLILKRDNDFFTCPTEAFFRSDVTEHFKNGFNLDNSGYSVRIKRNSMPQGRNSGERSFTSTQGESFPRLLSARRSIKVRFSPSTMARLSVLDCRRFDE